jgi:hypothetical protein
MAIRGTYHTPVVKGLGVSSPAVDVLPQSADFFPHLPAVTFGFVHL